MAYQKDLSLEYIKRLCRSLLAMEFKAAIHPHMLFTDNRCYCVHLFIFITQRIIFFQKKSPCWIQGLFALYFK